ncbi:hypothetical protein HNR23_001653 [Nocardiopsis mwathae]|uniref:Peptidase M14 domain-containing protein n=1 Tax=Nocardiopsis mwathae TaxID=1472723 RepID=A0A7W9YG93_9ACTN|nr:M14 family zinc carboxypeptidase [Nocardiopsis mwathae]MBB6171593.1 hypothetical protein [Nocardiopsis mwathae]
MTPTAKLATLLTALTIAATPAALTTPAHAHTPPPAPATTGHHIDPRPSTAELTHRLHQLHDHSNGRIRITEIGRTNQNRPIYHATVGTGPRRLLYITQQHGNEPLGTPAALEFLRHTGLGTTPWHHWLRSRITVDIIVRANPDGHENNSRYNHDPHADPEHGRKGKGYDPNRYHHPNLHPDHNPVPEAAAIQRTYAATTPDLVVDYHMQGRYTDHHGREITASVMWPTHPDVTTPATDLSRQATVAAAHAITTHHPANNVSTYPGGDYPGIARNAYGLHGSGSILIELSNIGPHAEQRQIRSALAAMTAIAQRTADTSLTRIDPARADRIPPRGAPIPTHERTPTPDHTDTLD